jgi:hypothetical protein
VIIKENPHLRSENSLPEKSLITASGSLPFGLKFGVEPIDLPNGKEIENEEKSTPNDPSPKDRERLGKRRRHHSTPIGES